MLASITLHKPSEAEAIAQLIMHCHADHRVFAFHGDLGAGKTTLIKGFCETLGVVDRTSSPSFAIVNEYRTAGGEAVYHFDLYRMRDASELDGIGFEEYLDSSAYCFIEWPELALDRLHEVLHVRITAGAKDVRTIRMD